MTLRIGIDVGGTNTDAVLLAEDRTVLASVKRPTTSDIESGVRAALEAVLEGQDVASVHQAMLGTTQCTNAIVERRGLRRVGVLRIGAPATTAVPPLADWPDDLREAVLADARVIGGGHHFDGREIAPLDVAAVRRAAEDWQGTVEAVAVSSVFSPADSGTRGAGAGDSSGRYLDVPISISSEIGSIGLLERENATVMNAALTGVAERATRGFTQALAAAGVQATPFLSQNDGTLMTLAYAAEYPVLTVASGPTNSLRGGALLSGRTDAVVIDVGGTTADFGALRGGFPRESGIAVEIGGVLTNFRMPDLVSVGLGGGTIVRRTDDGLRIGPDSVGHDITRRAVCFGGDTRHADRRLRAGRPPLGDRAAVRGAVSDDGGGGGAGLRAGRPRRGARPDADQRGARDRRRGRRWFLPGARRPGRRRGGAASAAPRGRQRRRRGHRRGQRRGGPDLPAGRPAESRRHRRRPAGGATACCRGRRRTSPRSGTSTWRRSSSPTSPATPCASGRARPGRSGRHAPLPDPSAGEVSARG